LWTLAAYLAGNTLKRASGTINLIFVGVAVLAIVITILFIRRRMSKLADRAEQAYPGPLE
jgi:Na+-transporting methylmalonyl-CoA/oxaloacetate decarboxylase gamma subunit